MAGYLISNVNAVHDAPTFKRYIEQVGPIIAKFGGRHIIRGPALDHVEGGLPITRLVVLEFPTLADAQKFYHSPEYAPVRQLRMDSTQSDILLVDGYAG